MVILTLIVAHHTRRSNLFFSIPTPLPRRFSNSLFPNSNGITSFADPYPLSLITSYRYKNHRGVGSLSHAALDSSSHFHHMRHRDENSFSPTPFKSATSDTLCHRDARNPFRIRSYENTGVSLTISHFGTAPFSMIFTGSSSPGTSVSRDFPGPVGASQCYLSVPLPQTFAPHDNGAKI